VTAAVRRLNPRAKLENIPHKLRAIAADIEAGTEGPYRAVVVVGMIEGGMSPDVFEIGCESEPLTVVGALTAAQLALLRTED